ncbi:MAG: VPLPA-CTERM sorting domain-containing protein [Gammaproteobacteria bacterium]
MGVGRNICLKTTGVALSILVLSTSANAAIVDGYGMAASTGTQSNCPSFCTTADGGDFERDFAGGEFSTLAVSSANSYGTAQASAQYSGLSTTYLPILNAYASSGLGKGASAEATGIQGYTYTGADKSITLNFNLHGSVENGGGGYASNQLRADIAVIAASSIPFETDFGTLIFEEVFDDVVDYTSLFISSGLDVDSPGSITFDVTDGMDFYVFAGLEASAKNGVADASNTLSLEFSDAVGLEAAVVPVPAAVWLFGSALAGLGWMRRKQAS